MHCLRRLIRSSVALAINYLQIRWYVILRLPIDLMSAIVINKNVLRMNCKVIYIFVALVLCCCVLYRTQACVLVTVDRSRTYFTAVNCNLFVTCLVLAYIICIR